MTEITIEQTEMSIAEYNIIMDTIHFWRWSKENVEFYRRPGESNIIMISRVLSHEILHAIIYAMLGRSATFAYDNITECKLRGLP